MAADGHRHVLAIGGLRGPSGPAAGLGPSGPAAGLGPSGPAAGLGPSGPDRIGPSREGTPPLLAYAARLTGARAPRICILNTASGDDPASYLRTYQLLGSIPGTLTHLQLFPMPNVTDPADLLLSQDMIFVGGGSVANMLAVWRLHGVDAIMRLAWQAGIVLSGVSAGAICWFASGTTDSFGIELRPFTDGLGMLAASYCPHYDSEARRRPLYQSLIADGTLLPGFACDDGAAAHFVDDDLAAIVADSAQPRGYFVDRTPAGAAIETKLDAKVLIGRLRSIHASSQSLWPSRCGAPALGSLDIQTAGDLRHAYGS